MLRHVRAHIGQSLVEIIVATGLLVSLTTSLAWLAVKSYGGETQAGDETTASFYAAQGLEGVRAIADADFSQLTDGDHGLDSSTGVYRFVGTSDTYGKFTRVITIGDVYRDGSGKVSGSSVAVIGMTLAPLLQGKRLLAALEECIKPADVQQQDCTAPGATPCCDGSMCSNSTKTCKTQYYCTISGRSCTDSTCNWDYGCTSSPNLDCPTNCYDANNEDWASCVGCGGSGPYPGQDECALGDVNCQGWTFGGGIGGDVGAGIPGGGINITIGGGIGLFVGANGINGGFAANGTFATTGIFGNTGAASNTGGSNAGGASSEGGNSSAASGVSSAASAGSSGASEQSSGESSGASSAASGGSSSGASAASGGSSSEASQSGGSSSGAFSGASESGGSSSGASAASGGSSSGASASGASSVASQSGGSSSGASSAPSSGASSSTASSVSSGVGIFDPLSKTVTVKITWSTGFRTLSVTFQSLFTDWRQ